MAIFNDNKKGEAKQRTYTQGGSQGTIFGGSVQKSIAESESQPTPTTLAIYDDGTLLDADAHSIDFQGEGLSVSEEDGTVDVSIDETHIATRAYVDQHSHTNLTEGTGIDITDDVISVDTDTIATQTYVDDEIGLIDIEDLNDVTVTSVQNGQSLIWDANDSMWVNAHATPVNPVDPNQSKITLTATPASIELASSGTSNITVNSTLTSGYTRVTTSIKVTDQERNPVTVVTASPTSITFVADHTLKGHFTVTATVVVTKTGETEQFTDTATITIPVNEPYYSAVSSTQPTSVDSMTEVGVFDHDKTEKITFTGDGGSDKAYFAVPTGAYTFHNGLTFAGTTSLGVIDTNWTLYEFTDFDDSQNNATFTISITED